MRRPSSDELRFRPWRRVPERDKRRSLWMHQALDRLGRDGERQLQGAERADVCIVGGGFTGLWTALRLRERDPSLRIALVEADLCGGGASGRNSGGVGHLWAKLPSLVKVLGPEDGKRLLLENLKSADDIAATCETYGIDCEMREGESAWMATADAQVGSWNATLSAAAELDLEPPYREMEPSEIRERFRSAPIRAALISKGRRLQPALLGRGLRHALVERADIYEHSPVRRIKRPASGPITVETELGSVTAERVVLAANAWMAHLAEFRSWVMVVSSDIVASDPIPQLLEERGLRERPGGANSRMMINYGGTTADGRVYLGRGGGTLAFDARIGPKFDYSAKQAAQVADDFHYLYPELADVELPYGWAGPVDRSPSGLPRFGHLEDDDRIHYAIGFTGHGVSATAEAGHVLAGAVLGADDDWAALGALYNRTHRMKPFPPEPVRFLGGQLVRRAVYRKEMAERNNQRPSPIDVKLAGLAPATIVDVGKGKQDDGADDAAASAARKEQ